MVPATEKSRVDKIYIGTHYEYPFGGNSRRPEWRPAGPGDWRKDLTVIRDTGFNLIRIRVGFDSSLDDVKLLLDLAHELELGVDFGFATFYAPDWFLEQHPDARVVAPDGRVFGPPDNCIWPRACIEHESYKEAWRKLLSDCAGRFASHPAIVLWDVHNEPTHECYCALSKRNFVHHLESRYHDIDRLNASWNSSFPDFAACAEPPTRREDGHDMGVESHYGAWRAFQTEALSGLLVEGFSRIRAHVTDTPVTYNVVASLDRGSDWWLTQESDVASLSAYWGSDAWTGNKAVRLALLAGLNPGKSLLVLETMGGQGPKFFSPTLWTGKHLELETWSFLGKGARGVIQYRWDPLLSENETMMFNMVDPNSNETEKRSRMKHVNERVRKLGHFLSRAAPPKCQVAIYFPRRTYFEAGLKYPSSFQMNGLGYAHSLPLDGWYGLLSQAGFVAGVHCQPLEALSGDEALVVPFSEFLTDEEWAALEARPASGRKTILQLPIQTEVACANVSSRLGLNFDRLETRAWTLDGWSMVGSEDATIGAAYGSRAHVEPSTGSDVLARFYDNNRPALFEMYEGYWLIAAFDVGMAYDHMLHKELRSTIARWIADGGTAPYLDVRGILDDYRPLVEANVLEVEDQALVICCNRSPYDWDTTIRPAGFDSVRLKLRPFEATQEFAAKR